VESATKAFRMEVDRILEQQIKADDLKLRVLNEIKQQKPEP